MDKNNVIILGNGFDLAFGYRTSYSDFATIGFGQYCSELLGTDFWPFNGTPKQEFADGCLYSHLKQYKESKIQPDGSLGWIDLETELLNYAISRKGKHNSESLIEYDKICFEWLRNNLWYFIKRMVPRERKSEFKIQAAALSLLKAIKDNGTFGKIINFNYSNPQYTLEQFCSFKENEIPSIEYIHGKTHGMSPNEDNIIVGINETNEVPKEYRFLYKSIQVAPHNFTIDLLNAEIIVIYGLAMGVIDNEYFETFFTQTLSQQLTGNKKQMIFVTKDNHSAQSIKDNIIDMGFKWRKLTELVEIHFIVMDNLLNNSSNESIDNIMAILAPKNKKNPYIGTASIERGFDY